MSSSTIHFDVGECSSGGVCNAQCEIEEKTSLHSSSTNFELHVAVTFRFSFHPSVMYQIHQQVFILQFQF
jgi:hypothetical protein